MIRLRQAPFVDRNNFPFFLRDRGLTESAVEVGVHRGEYGALFVQNWRGKRWFGIDPWETLPGYEEQTKVLSNCDGNRETDWHVARAALLAFNGHKDFALDAVTLIKDTSLNVVKTFHDGVLDFVYIDGDHRKEEVAKDLRAWWPKLRSGGILAGHDLVCHDEGEMYEGLQEAVIEFAQEVNRTIWMVIEIKCLPWSFYLEKP